MKKMSFDEMKAIQASCGFEAAMFGIATASLYLAPFTGGGSLGIAAGALALAGFVGAAYSYGGCE